MASVTKKPNGTYLIRFCLGKVDLGNQKTVSKIFRPSRPNLGYASLQKEINLFIDETEVQLLSGTFENSTGAKVVPQAPGRMLFSDFCEKFIEIKQNDLTPCTLAFYKQITATHLIPTYGKMHLAYLKEHRRGTYSRLLMTCKLNEHLHKIDLRAREMLRSIIDRVAAERGINEAMKAENALLWVQEMNNCKSAAEEILLREVINQ